VGKASYESLDFKFFLQFEFEDLGFIIHLYVNVDFVFLYGVKHTLNDMELMLVDGTLELVFVFNDNVSTSITTANRSLFSGGTLVFIDPAASRAFSTEEIFTSVTEITDVYEIESDVST